MSYRGSLRKKIEARVRVSRAQGPDHSYVHLFIQDQASGLTIVDLDLSMEQWAIASMSGEGRASGEVYVNPNIGKKHECLRVVVPIPNPDKFTSYDVKSWGRFKAYARGHCKKIYPDYEMDEIGDANHHNYRTIDDGTEKGCRGYEVMVRRYV